MAIGIEIIEQPIKMMTQSDDWQIILSRHINSSNYCYCYIPSELS